LEDAGRRDPVALINGAMGTDAGALIWGRAVTAKGLDHGTPDEGLWKKFQRTFRIFTPKKLKHRAVIVEIFNRETQRTESHRVMTDKYGNFELRLEGHDLKDLATGAHPIAAKVEGKSFAVAASTGRLRIYPRKGTLVVSDIDDTILDTRVNQRLKMIKKVLFSNAHDLRTFAGASGLFQAFGDQGFPTIFVTSSPSNLDTRLGAFLKLNGFPAKLPLLMKTLGKDKFSGDHGSYKQGQLAKVMGLFGGYKVVAIGDSGQADQQIYETLRNRLGDERVRFIAIRRVPRVPAKGYAGQFLFDDYAEAHRRLETSRILPTTTKKRTTLTRTRQPLTARMKRTRR
jgi:phosphatidate phosphatase APP1